MSFWKPAEDPGTRRQRSRVLGIGCATRNHIRPLAARADYSRCPPAGPGPAAGPPFLMPAANGDRSGACPA